MQKLCEKHFRVHSSEVTTEMNDNSVFVYFSFKQLKQTFISKKFKEKMSNLPT